MARERWPKARRSSGANQRALRSVSGFFLTVIGTPVRDPLRSSHRQSVRGKPRFDPLIAGCIASSDFPAYRARTTTASGTMPRRDASSQFQLIEVRITDFLLRDIIVYRVYTLRGLILY